jgi:leucyl-tRNA synthetase
MKRYNPKEIEPKWQNVWSKQKLYAAIDFDKRTKYIMLTEFPYPSGDGLHMGHIREYTYGDVLARFRRMQGHNVLYPMGYDAFGLPTENYAIKNKISPQEATDKNVATFQKQLEEMGYSIDWNRSFCTSDPRYYLWTQWLFLQFFKAGLAYQAEIAINWCPHCKTGLSNEEVINGRHERCDTLVEKRLLKQWLLRITDYAERLLEGLKDVDYPSRIADQQKNWIGRSEGANINFYSIDDVKKNHPITVFTTRPDTLFGATFLVLAPEHPLVEIITKDDHKDVVHSYVKQTQSKTDIERQATEREKTGVFIGAYALNPVTGTNIPIWIADYVLGGYGTGAIMAVPAHDERDWEFAQKYHLPVMRVIKNDDPDEMCTLKPGTMINSGDFNGMKSTEATTAIISFIEKEGFGSKKIQYKLRDWIFSRQHYWGEPIPIIHCPEHGAVAVPDDQLPVELPVLERYEPTDNGESPLSAITDWVNTTCPVCNSPAKRETDTMPNWAGSSWYYLRYYDPHNNEAFADKPKLEYWGAVDLYLGGMEHTTLHLLYSRFWHQFFYDQGLVPTPEPFAARRGQGIILAADGSKMSKSKGNVVNPSDILDSGYGADALRLAIIFLAPYDQTTPWSPESVAGTHRFLQRVWTLVREYIDTKPSTKEDDSDELKQVIHPLIFKVTTDLERLSFNTAIAACMQTVNDLYHLKAKDGFTATNWEWALKTLLQLISPFAPHISEELWHDLNEEHSIHVSPWPDYDKTLIVKKTVTIAVQVNGKLRGSIEIERDAPEEEVIAKAKEQPKVASYLKEQIIRKSVYVNNRLVNFVL